MDIKVVELNESKARLVFRGQNHTFMNMLTEEILKDPSVDLAKYSMEFQFSDPELIVTTTDGKDPLAVVAGACRRLIGYCDELLEQVRSAESA